jgi:hypothetical protein
MSRRRQRRQYRDASVTLEFILVLPLLVVTLFAVAQFTVALLVRQAVTQAAIVGAREAGKGEGIVEVARAVDGVLDGAHGIDLATVTFTPGSAPSAPGSASVTPVALSGVRVWLEVGQPDVLSPPITSSFGDTAVPCLPPTTPVVQADEVRVTVAIDLGRRPMCNWLFNFSPEYVDFSTRYSQISSLVRKE